MTKTALILEARAWLRDCELPSGGEPAAVQARVQREYDGGWSAFVTDGTTYTVRTP